MGNPPVQVTSPTVERIEDGDPAIDPLYPTFLSLKGAEPILSDPGLSELRQALQEACADRVPPPPLHRALMQADTWPAYDIVGRAFRAAGVAADHARILLPLLAQFIAKLVLTDDEIAALPHYYLIAQSSQNLPQLLDQNSGWIEIEWSPGRSHDEMGGNRHAARIFLRPATKPQSFSTMGTAGSRNTLIRFPEGFAASMERR